MANALMIAAAAVKVFAVRLLRFFHRPDGLIPRFPPILSPAKDNQKMAIPVFFYHLLR
ncbi:MAG: hypothetical protein LBP90_05310 [Burkholderiales bacterium]|nr:hypothetical protein [Burkholderiales bacterium]